MLEAMTVFFKKSRREEKSGEPATGGDDVDFM
jgi:hypothetical protein